MLQKYIASMQTFCTLKKYKLFYSLLEIEIAII